MGLTRIRLHTCNLFPAVARGNRLKRCTARIVPNHAASRKRNPLEPEKRPATALCIARLLVGRNQRSSTSSSDARGASSFRLFPNELPHMLQCQRQIIFL